jgi:hypothetical protein
MTPFDEILRRRRRERQPWDERLPGGESVPELLQRVQDPLNSRPDPSVPAPPSLEPRPDPALVRPRQVQPEITSRPRAVTFDPRTGRPNEDFYRERGDSAGLYNAYQNWNPHGGKRGFKNSLKAALMMGAEGARTNPDDPVTGALAGLAIGAGGATAMPNFTNRLRRQQKLGQFGGELKDQLDLQKQQAAIDQSQMVEVELENGQKVLVPAKSAATLQSRQQEIGLRGDTLEARKRRWGQLGEHEAARDAQALYNSGAADDSAELRAEIAKRLRLPADTVLPPRGLGNQIKLDDAGNYVVISPRSGAVTPTRTPDGKPAVSFQKTQEENRDTRQRRALAATDARTRYIQEQTNKRVGMRGAGQARVDPATRREVARGVGALEAVKGELSQLDARIKQLDDASKGRERTADELAQIASLGRQRQEVVNRANSIAAQLNDLDPNNETGVGTGGYPYRKPRAQQAPSDLDQSVAPNPKRWSISRWQRANPNGDVEAAKRAAAAKQYEIVP